MSRLQEFESASEGSTWRDFWSKLMELSPYMWSKNSPLLQLRVLACILLIVLRVTNVLVPNCLTTLSLDNSWTTVEVLLWVVLKLMQGGVMGQGLLDNLRSYLWITLQQ